MLKRKTTSLLAALLLWLLPVNQAAADGIFATGVAGTFQDGAGVINQGGPVFNQSASTLFAAMVPPPSAARKVIINNTIVALQNAGIWTSCDTIHVMAAEAAQNARLNWKAPGTFTLADGGTPPTFTANQGFQGNAVDGFLNPSWVPNTNGVNFVQDSASVWVWSRTNAQSNVAEVGSGGNPGDFIITRSSTDTIAGRLNDNDATTRANTDSSGLIGNQRISAATKRYWRNGAQLGADISVASVGRSTTAAWLNGAGTASFSAKQQAAAAFCDSLQGKEADFYAIMNDYMVAVGAQAFDTDAQTLITAMSGPPSTQRQQLINSTVVRLKAKNIWGSCDLIYVTAADAAANGRLNWKAPGSFALADGGTAPTFVVDRGFTGDGVSGRLVPGWSASPNGVNYVQDSASMWVWSRTAAGTNPADIGVTAAVGMDLIIKAASGNMAGRMNDNALTSRANALDGSGFYGNQRIDAATKRYWGNGAQITTDIAVASTGLPTGNIWLLGANNSSFSTRQEAAAAVCNSLQGKEADFYTVMTGYMVAVGASP